MSDKMQGLVLRYILAAEGGDAVKEYINLMRAALVYSVDELAAVKKTHDDDLANWRCQVSQANVARRQEIAEADGKHSNIVKSWVKSYSDLQARYDDVEKAYYNDDEKQAKTIKTLRKKLREAKKGKR